MARGEIFEARVERIVTGGAGLARPEGKSVFIGMAAPGDRIRGRIIKEHKNWAEAELLEIPEPSPDRVEPVCPLYGRCGGCSLQHLNYETQVKVKKDILHDTFVRIGGINPPDIPVRFSVPFEYRNRVQFHRSNTRPCFRERKSSTPVFLDDCPVADAGIRRALKEGTIIPPPNKDRFNVYSRFNTFLSEGGAERGRVSILDRELAMDAGVFFQSNAAMLESLINDLAALASTADKDLPLADLYCGVGTFAAFLGPGFAGVDLVEENRAALELARENVNGKNLNCHALSAENWVNSIKTKKKHWGLMILDPPREGLSGPLREWLAGNGPELAAYVSCDPAALARDSKVLLEGGYVLRGLSLYDFYPQTAHVESLAVFSRRDNET